MYSMLPEKKIRISENKILNNERFVQCEISAFSPNYEIYTFICWIQHGAIGPLYVTSSYKTAGEFQALQLIVIAAFAVVD